MAENRELEDDCFEVSKPEFNDEGIIIRRSLGLLFSSDISAARPAGRSFEGLLFRFSWECRKL
jgi:hypothetical protein